MTSYNRTDATGEKLIVVSPANKLKAKRGPVFQESRSRIRGHNFAIRLLQTLESRMHAIVEDFSVGEGARRQHSTLDRTQFITKMMHQVRRGPSSLEESSWLSSMSDSELHEKLGDVFDSADSQNSGRISFSMLIAYVIDCASYGEVGLVQEAIPDYTGSAGTVFRNIEDICKAKYCPELEQVLLAGKQVGVMASQSLHVKSFLAYPHLNTAADKFATAYDIDYVPHLEALVFAGTERYLDLIHAQTGERVLKIPMSHTCTVCSFDRSTRMLLTSRDSVVDTFALKEFRHNDELYHVGRSLHFHTGTINAIRPLNRGGLTATASSDKTVVICDTEVGECITTFRAHTNAVHSVEYIEHMNLMLSTAYDTEPKVWMLASSAMRSEAFTLRDVENPHTGVVISACTVADTPQVCTLDLHGTVKLWDIRMFRAQQSIRLEKTMDGIFDAKALKWHSVVWDPVAQELVAFAQRRAQKLRRKVLVKDDNKGGGSPPLGSPSSSPTSKRDKGPPPPVSLQCSMADETPILLLVYEPVSQTVVSLTEKKVRVWDVFTGHQEAMFDKIIPYDTHASALCVSSNGKSFFLGLRNGRLTSHQFSSGTLLQTFIEEGPEITSLTYCAYMQTFCAVTWRGARLFPDKHLDTTSFFPDSTKGAEVKATSFDPLTASMLTMERRGHLSFWESRSGRFTLTSTKCAGTIAVGNHQEISAAHVLTGLPVVAVSTAAGGLSLHTMSPHPVPYRKFAEALFRGREITCMVFYPPKFLLYCGDDQGWIHAMDVSAALESISCITLSQSWTGMMSTIGRTGTAPRDVVILRTVAHVHAHSESVVSLVWALKLNVIITASSDHRILLWDLSLRFLGELDPMSEAGHVSIPYSNSDASTFDYVVTPAPGECAPFAASSSVIAEGSLSIVEPGEKKGVEENVPQSPSKRSKISAASTNSTVASGFVSMTIGADQNRSSQGGEFSAAKFAEDVHRLAEALEAFVPSAAPRKERDLLKELGTLGVESSPVSKVYAKRAKPASPNRRKRGTQSVGDATTVAAGEGASGDAAGGSEEPPNASALMEEHIYSANSTGVACRSLFSPVPMDTASRSPKRVVVDQVTTETATERGGDPFVVTRDFPLPPHARRDRDWLIRELQLKEEREAAVTAKKEAAEREAEENGLLFPNRTTMSGSHRRGSTALEAQQQSRPSSRSSSANGDNCSRPLPLNPEALIMSAQPPPSAVPPYAQMSNDSFASLVLPASGSSAHANLRRGPQPQSASTKHRGEGFVAASFFDSPAGFDVLPQQDSMMIDQDHNRTTFSRTTTPAAGSSRYHVHDTPHRSEEAEQCAVETPVPLQQLYRQLLPHELLSMKREWEVRKKQWNRDQKARGRVATTQDLNRMHEVWVRQWMEDRGHHHPPLPRCSSTPLIARRGHGSLTQLGASVTIAAAQRPALTHWGTREEVTWFADSTLRPSTSVATLMDAAPAPAITSNQSFLAGDVPTVSYTMFGVRSITPHLQIQRRCGTPQVWAKSHRVDDDCSLPPVGCNFPTPSPIDPIRKLPPTSTYHSGKALDLRSKPPQAVVVAHHVPHIVGIQAQVSVSGSESYVHLHRPLTTDSAGSPSSVASGVRRESSSQRSSKPPTAPK